MNKHRIGDRVRIGLRPGHIVMGYEERDIHGAITAISIESSPYFPYTVQLDNGETEQLSQVDFVNLDAEHFAGQVALVEANREAAFRAQMRAVTDRLRENKADDTEAVESHLHYERRR